MEHNLNYGNNSAAPGHLMSEGEHELNIEMAKCNRKFSIYQSWF
jgi:hypothetical protein